MNKDHVLSKWIRKKLYLNHKEFAEEKMKCSAMLISKHCNNEIVTKKWQLKYKELGAPKYILEQLRKQGR